MTVETGISSVQLGGGQSDYRSRKSVIFTFLVWLLQILSEQQIYSFAVLEHYEHELCSSQIQL